MRAGVGLAPLPGDLRSAAEPPPRWWRDSLRRRILASADVAAATGASLAIEPTLAASFGALAFLPLWVLLAKLLGLYDRDHRAIRHLTIDELPAIVAWSVGGAVMLAALMPVIGADPVSAGGMVRACLIAGSAAFVMRGAGRWMWRRMTPAERTIVLGEGEFRNAILRKAELFRDMHLALIEPGRGRLTNGSNGHDEAGDGDGDGGSGMPAAEGRELEPLLTGVDRVIVASERVDPDLLGELSALCRTHQVKLSVVSPLRGRALPSLRISQVADLPLFEYNTWDVSRSTMLLKRVFDLTVASVALVVTAPLVPVVALAIKLDSRGPVFFSQRRAGLNGRPFRMYKFRTMRDGAVEALPGLVSFEALEEPVFKIQGDPRVTRVGRVLRRLSLDEIPQLVNVLRGEMSVVGPRPEQTELVGRYRPEHRFRLTVKPGISGPMQVFGRGELTFAERLAVELDYVENLSLARDIRILFQTFPAVARGTGAF